MRSVASILAKLKPSLPRIVEVALLLLVVALVAQFVLDRHAKGQVKDAPKADQPPRNAGQVDVDKLAEIPLFGESKKVEVTPKKAPVVPSTLKLELVGTVVAVDGSVAIVKGAGNHQQVAMVGDKLQQGVLLKEIATDSITIENQGRLERIALPRNQLAGVAAPAVPASAPTATAVRQPATNAAMATAAPRQQPTITAGPTIPLLMQQARLVPHFAAGKVDGVLVSAVQAGSVFEDMGLQGGDVIRSLDGKAVAAPQQIMALYQAVIDARPVDIELERGGQMQQIHYGAKAQ